MPLYNLDSLSESGGITENGGTNLLRQSDNPRPHQDRFCEAGYQSEDFLAMVHKPVSIPDALQIPSAEAAMENNGRNWKTCSHGT